MIGCGRFGVAAFLAIAIVETSSVSESLAMSNDLQALIAAVLARAPQWIRQGLLSKERAAKVRAEETLPAMIEQAIRATVAD